MIIKKVLFALIALVALISCSEDKSSSNQGVDSTVDAHTYDKSVTVLLYYSNGDHHSLVMLTSDTSSNRNFGFLDSFVVNSYYKDIILDTALMHQIGSYLHNTNSKKFHERESVDCWWSFSIIDRGGKLTAYSSYSNYDMKKVFAQIAQMLKVNQKHTTQDALDFFQNWKEILSVSDTWRCI